MIDSNRLGEDSRDTFDLWPVAFENELVRVQVRVMIRVRVTQSPSRVS